MFRLDNVYQTHGHVSQSAMFHSLSSSTRKQGVSVPLLADSPGLCIYVLVQNGTVYNREISPTLSASVTNPRVWQAVPSALHPLIRTVGSVGLQPTCPHYK